MASVKILQVVLLKSVQVCGDHHELVIRNTGHLNGNFNPDGFGISSTQSRLKLMFGDALIFSCECKRE
jgi:hypothetical protein